MKVKHLILLLTVLLYTVAVAGREFVSVRFSESEFSFTRNSFNCINIVPANPISSYGEDVSKPALPLFPVNVLLPEGTSYKGIKILFLLVSVKIKQYICNFVTNSLKFCL